MNETRKIEIQNNLTNKGVKEGVKYNNAELLSVLLEYQNALSESVFTKLHAEHLAAKDVLLHFRCLAEEYGLEQSEEFLRFDANMSKLQRTIRALINGNKGEREAAEALRLITLDKGVEVLSNIEIQDGNDCTEYDEIVISPNGIFVIEVKNYKNPMKLTKEGNLVRQDGVQHGPKYNLGVKMNKKEFLLRKLLAEKLEEVGLDIPIYYNGIILFTNNESNLIDEYNQIPICYCSTISQYIRSQNCDTEPLTTEQIVTLKRIIRELHTPLKYTCEFSCEEITNDFAHLMAVIEEAADNRDSVAKPYSGSEDGPSEKNSIRKNVAKYVVAASLVATIMARLALKGRA